MPLSHLAFLVCGLGLIAGMFVVASRAPSDADVEYRPYQPALQDQASATSAAVARSAGNGDKVPIPTREPSADTVEGPLRGASAARP